MRNKKKYSWFNLSAQNDLISYKYFKNWNYGRYLKKILQILGFSFDFFELKSKFTEFLICNISFHAFSCAAYTLQISNHLVKLFSRCIDESLKNTILRKPLLKSQNYSIKSMNSQVILKNNFFWFLYFSNDFEFLKIPLLSYPRHIKEAIHEKNSIYHTGYHS